MPTCPNCGEIVMNGDPYCSHCGTTFSWGDDEDDEDDCYRYSGRSHSIYSPPSKSEFLSSKASMYRYYLDGARSERDPARKMEAYRKVVDKGIEYLNFAKEHDLEPLEIPDINHILARRDVEKCGDIYYDYLSKFGILTDYEKTRKDCRYVLKMSGNSGEIAIRERRHNKAVELSRKQYEAHRQKENVIKSRENYFKNIQKANKFVLRDSKSKALNHYKKAIENHESYFNGKYEKYDSGNSKIMPQPPERLTEEAIYYLLILYQKTHPLLASSKSDLTINSEVSNILSALHTAELIEADNNVKDIVRQRQAKRQMQKEKVEDVITDGIVGVRLLGDKLLNRLKK